MGGDFVFVSPDSALSYWRRDLEASGSGLFRFAEEFVKVGDVVWDVGANVGLFTFASAYRAGPSGYVVAIEPDIFLVNLLRKSAASMSENRAKVVVLPAATSKSLGVSEFHIAKRGRSSNHLASSNGNGQTGGVREIVSVITITLDWLMERIPPPTILKIDVEGAEADLLLGAQELISRVRPIILCEVSSSNIEFCTRFLTAHGYSLYDHDNRARGKIHYAATNTLAVHEG
jgi:FkbM family methyltransferase